MSACTFFGHRDCYGLSPELLRSEIEKLINRGVNEFLVGNHGKFDAMARTALRSLQAQYPHIRYKVVLAYLPSKYEESADLTDTVYPEGLENVHPKFAVEWRNRYLINSSDICICCVNRTWGGAYKFARMAVRRGLSVVNLGSADLG